MVFFRNNPSTNCSIPLQNKVIYHKMMYYTGLGLSTVDQVLKYIKYPKYMPSTSTGQVLIYLKST